MLKTSPGRPLHKICPYGKSLYSNIEFRPAHGARLASHKSEAYRLEQTRVKASIILGLLILASGSHATEADQLSGYYDFDVVSVAPRSRDIKPFVMAILSKEQRQRIAAASFRKNAFAAKDGR